jgi:hypothetical protein
VRDLFSLCLAAEADDYSEASDDNIMFSRWCTGARPIPTDILKTYHTEMGYSQMMEDFNDKIIPNLINVPHAKEMVSELIDISRPVIGNAKADELLASSDYAEFFTKAMLYAILCDHEKSGLYSPDLTDVLLNCRLPSVSREFVGRTAELKECAKISPPWNLIRILRI